ncbi:MAG: STAS domain-containing protein [Bacilli bacterium]|nr:STAS domain-containing protein [Bacilli bacterium]MBO4682921.1 STAS domain-containing protein [Bacilli bacterium]
MDINKTLEGKTLVIALTDKLDTTSAPALEEDLNNSLNGIDTLIFDFSKLNYLSSAGLRVLLNTQKTMMKQGKMIIKHPNDVIMSVFEMTGFSTILTIED